MKISLRFLFAPLIVEVLPNGWKYCLPSGWKYYLPGGWSLLLGAEPEFELTSDPSLSILHVCICIWLPCGWIVWVQLLLS